MHILTGTLKGLSLAFPRDQRLRPTSDKVRAALFNILGDRVVGVPFLDLCAGTGAVGLEAVSCGASGAVFVDVATPWIKRNIAAVTDRVDVSLTVVTSPALVYLKKCQDSFGVIFIDPPWDVGDYDEMLALIVTRGLLQPGGIVVCEHRRRKDIVEPEGLQLVKSYVYGDTVLRVSMR